MSRITRNLVRSTVPVRIGLVSQFLRLESGGRVIIISDRLYQSAAREDPLNLLDYPVGYTGRIRVLVVVPVSDIVSSRYPVPCGVLIIVFNVLVVELVSRITRNLIRCTIPVRIGLI